MTDSNAEMNHLIETDHKELLASLDKLEVAFDEIPDHSKFMNWKVSRLWQLRDFYNQLQKHFDLEEHGGYNEKLARQAPHLISKVEHLEEEHRKITSDLNHILNVMKGIDHAGSAKIERVKCRVENLITFVRKHEATENGVIQEAYYQDYGIGD